MTRKLSVMTAVGVAALSFGAPAAFGGVHAGGEAAAVLAQPNPVIGYGDAHERGLATNPAQSSLTGYRDSFERTVLTRGSAPVSVATYRDAFERANVAGNQSGVLNYHDPFVRGTQVDVSTRLESNVGRYSDAFERTNLPTTPVATSPVGSGTDIEWPQIGFGLGIGLLLALGLGLIMRTAHVRPFAH